MARFWAVCVALTKEPAMVAATAMELLWMEMGVPAVMKADSTAPSLAAAVLFAAIVFSSHRVRPQPSSRSQLSFCISTVLAHSIQNNMARGRHGRAWLQAQRLRDTVPTVFDDAALLSTIATARASVSHRGIYDTDDTFDDHLRGQLASNDAFSFPANTSNMSPHLAKDVIVRGMREQFKGSAAVTIRSDTTGRPSQSETAKARNMRPEPTTILSFMDTDARAPGESLATAPATSHAPSTAPGRASGQPIVAEPATPYL